MEHSPYSRILGIICSVFDAYTAVLFVKDGKSGAKRCSLAAAFSLGEKLNTQAVVEEGQGLVGWILRNQSPLLVPNFDRRRNYLGYYTENEEQTIKAFMGCALPGGRGVICVDSKRQYSFSEKDQKMLYLFAELLASLYDMNSALSTSNASAHYYAALNMIYLLRRRFSKWGEFLHAFLQAVAQASGYEYCALCTKTDDGAEYHIEGESTPLLTRAGHEPRYTLSSGMVGWVFRNAEPLFSGGNDGASETPLIGAIGDTPSFQSAMAWPLRIQRKVRGVLCLASAKSQSRTEEVTEFARMVSEHLALYLENLYVKCRLRDLHQSMHTANHPPQGLAE